MGSIITIQSGAHQFTNSDITKYSLMMGGLNVTHDVLKQYDPLVTGNYRLFMVRKPTFVDLYFGRSDKGLNRFTAFKHILEYGNLGVSGIGGYTMEYDQIRGGYAGRQFDVPKSATDDTNSFTVKLFEFSGSPIREVLHTWINGMSDLHSGLTHYNGLIAAGEIGYSQANQTAEFIYVVTDRTGMKVEYACQLCNCMPKQVPADHFNSDAGEHQIVNLDIEFTCTKYEGVDVNEKAKILLRNHQIMANSLEFFSGLDAAYLKADVDSGRTGYNPRTGKLSEISSKKVLDRGDTKSEITYTTDIDNDNPNAIRQDINFEDGAGNLRPTPSYTDIGNRHVE